MISDDNWWLDAGARCCGPWGSAARTSCDRRSSMRAFQVARRCRQHNSSPHHEYSSAPVFPPGLVKTRLRSVSSVCCGLKTPEPSGLSLPGSPVAVPRSAACQRGKPLLIKMKREMFLAPWTNKAEVSASDDGEVAPPLHALTRRGRGRRSWNLPVKVVWLMCGTSLRLVVGNLGNICCIFPSPPARLPDRSRVSGASFSTLSDLQASQLCPQITV